MHHMRHGHAMSVASSFGAFLSREETNIWASSPPSADTATKTPSRQVETEWQQKIRGANEGVSATALRKANTALIEADVKLRAAHAEVAERDGKLRTAHAELAERDGKLRTAHAEAAERDGKLRTAHAELAERDAKLAERDAKLAEADAKLAEADAKLAEADAKLAERDAELLAEQGSRSKIAAELQAAKHKLDERADAAERESRANTARMALMSPRLQSILKASSEEIDAMVPFTTKPNGNCCYKHTEDHQRRAKKIQELYRCLTGGRMLKPTRSPRKHRHKRNVLPCDGGKTSSERGCRRPAGPVEDCHYLMCINGAKSNDRDMWAIACAMVDNFGGGQ